MAYKRKTKNVGCNTTETTTQKSDGSVRITRSRKHTPNLTISTSVGKNGRTKRTVTTNTNGWINRKSSTTPTFKPIKTRIRKPATSSTPRRKSQNLDFNISGYLIFFLFCVGVSVTVFPATLPLVIFILGVMFSLWLLWMILPFLIWGSIIFGIVYLLSLFV